MKNMLTIILLVLVLNVSGQSGNGNNYVVTCIPNEAIKEADCSSLSIQNSRINVQYMDEFGRPELMLEQQGTPSGNDLISLTEYDEAGRASKQWIPVPVNGGTGTYRFVDIVKGKSDEYHGGNAYSETIYENSSLNRVKKKCGPGWQWHGSDKSVKTEYLTNTQSGELAVKKYTVAVGSDILQGGDLYPAGSTYVVRMEDEDGNVRYEFTDFEGRIVLSRVIGEAGNHDTYFVYNNDGDLRVVLPPLAADYPSLINKNIGEIPYAYCYWYDDKHQKVTKKIPGCDPIYCVYDRTGRVVMSQTGNQRKTNEWTYNKYDFAGRLVIMGICTNAGTHESLIEAYSYRSVIESFNSQSAADRFGYTRNFVMGDGEIPLVVNYYDFYDYQDLSLFSGKGLGNKRIPGYEAGYMYDLRGMHTGSFIACLDDPSKGEYTAYYYAETTYQPVQVVSNGFDIGYYNLCVTTKYNFARQPVSKLIEYSGNVSVKQEYTYSYDHSGRLIDTYHQLENNDKILLSHNEYNEVGGLALKTRHNNSDTITYAYNVRGWISEIRSDLFTENLYYNETLLPGGIKCYNGNVADVRIEQNGNSYHQLCFYDKLNRLSSSRACTESGGSLGKGSFRESLFYDKMGNITTLERMGKDNSYVSVQMQYDGNQVKSAYGFTNDSYIPTDVCLSYPNDVDLETEYYYDANGNLRANLDYGIVAIRNNILNLPDTIQLKNGNQIINHYLADGRRYGSESKTYLVPLVVPLGVVVNSSDPYTTKTDVIHGDCYYKNGILSMVKTSGGYISYTRVGIDSHPEKSYFYYTYDHLGNVRIAQNFDGWIRNQSTEYYPTTLHYGRSTSPELQPFKYGGKELITMHGIDAYDFSSRMLSPMLMRFMSIDPLCEKYYSTSPYAYCANNPVRYVDPTGNYVESAWDIASLAMGVKSFVDNVKGGNVLGAVVDGVGIVLDAAATALPVVPGGAGAAIKGVRAIDKAVDVAKTADKAVDTGKAVEKTVSTSRAARREVMRQNGIPTSQQPKTQSKNASGREYSYEVPKDGGGTEIKSVQQQTLDSSHKESPHWEAGAIKTDDWGNPKLNSYGRPKLDSNKSKVNYE